MNILNKLLICSLIFFCFVLHIYKVYKIFRISEEECFVTKLNTIMQVKQIVLEPGINKINVLPVLCKDL